MLQPVGGPAVQAGLLLSLHQEPQPRGAVLHRHGHCLPLRNPQAQRDEIINGN